MNYSDINAGEVARQSQQLWQGVKGWCWEQQQRDVFCLAQADVCADLHKHWNLLTRLPHAPCVPASLGPCSLPALDDEFTAVEQY